MQTATQEPGLVTLMAEGLQLNVDDRAVSEALNFLIGDAPKVPGAPIYEALRWVPAANLPADDTTYLLQVAYPDGQSCRYMGQWLGQYWSHEGVDAKIQGHVRYYADPKGPAL